jgi:hypothetical protein
MYILRQKSKSSTYPLICPLYLSELKVQMKPDRTNCQQALLLAHELLYRRDKQLL